MRFQAFRPGGDFPVRVWLIKKACGELILRLSQNPTLAQKEVMSRTSLISVFLPDRREFVIKEFGRHLRDLLVHGFAVDSGIIHEKLWKLLFSGLGADVEKRVMGHSVWQDSEFRTRDIPGEKLRVPAGRSNGIRCADDNAHRNRDGVQGFRRKRASDRGSDGEDGSD